MEKALTYLKENNFSHKVATDEDIRAIEEKYGITLNERIKYFFKNITGFDGVQTDHVALYGLNDFEPAKEYMSKDVIDENRSRYFLIGDFDSWCWGYVIYLSDDEKIPVYLVKNDAGPITQIAEDIEEFILMSVDTSAGLLG